MSEVNDRAAYRNLWADAYRTLVSEHSDREQRYERIRIASAQSWDRGERLSEDEIRDRVEALTRSDSAPGDNLPDDHRPPSPRWKRRVTTSDEIPIALPRGVVGEICDATLPVPASKLRFVRSGSGQPPARTAGDRPRSAASGTGSNTSGR